MRTRHGAAVAVLVIFVACGSGDHRTTVTAIAAKTVATGTFRVAVTNRTYDTANPTKVEDASSGQGLVDLAHRTSTLTTTGTSQADPGSTGAIETTEMIAIGRDRWLHTTPGAIGSKPWVHTALRTDQVSSIGLGDPQTMFATLQTQGATARYVDRATVRGVATRHYVVDLPTSSTRSDFVEANLGLAIWIDGHDVVRRERLVFHMKAQPHYSPPQPAETIEETAEFYDFGTPVDIQPPPADQVYDPADSCAGSGTVLSFKCGATTQPLAPVPPLPPPNARSSLQLRPVLGHGSGSCAPGTVNPRADQSATVVDAHGGGCYELGPTQMTITHAEVTIVRDPVTGDLAADFTLDAVDAAAFDEVASKNLDRQVAVVAFGTVLSAPTIQTAQFNGRGQINGVDLQTAANIKASLSG